MQRSLVEPFDGTDPFNRLAEHYRKGVADLALKAMRRPDYRALEVQDQFQAFLAGTMTGVLGCACAQIDPAGHQDVVDWLISYLPQALAQIDGIA